MTELRPCPFCGGTDIEGEEWLVCLDCGTDGPSDPDRRKRWNTRPAEDELLDALETGTAQFRLYERLHMEKGSIEGDAKARTNAEFAEKFEALIAKYRPEKPHE